MGTITPVKKLFIPKGANLEIEQINRLRTKYPFLTDQNIAAIQYWSDPHSHYEGTIISEQAEHTCYPYDRNEKGFRQEHPTGTIWGK